MSSATRRKAAALTLRDDLRRQPPAICAGGRGDHPVDVAERAEQLLDRRSAKRLARHHLVEDRPVPHDEITIGERDGETGAQRADVVQLVGVSGQHRDVLPGAQEPLDLQASTFRARPDVAVALGAHRPLVDLPHRGHLVAAGTSADTDDGIAPGRLDALARVARRGRSR